VLKILENYITELRDRPNRPENPELELEDKVDVDEKGSYILRSVGGRGFKKMRDKKTTGGDGVLGTYSKRWEVFRE
jgi:hypothetical protein